MILDYPDEPGNDILDPGNDILELDDNVKESFGHYAQLPSG